MDGVTDSGQLVVNRWKRYGKDRLYVSTPEQTSIGWWDLLTDEAHPETPEHLEALTAAVASWRTGGAEPAAEQAAPGPLAETVIETPWVDLATNRPGAGVRDRAESAYVAAPVRATLHRLLGVKNDERAWRKGAEGEELVGKQLAKLAAKDSRWVSLHSVPVGDRGADIDHLVIGPGGVFTINAKHHPNADVWVGGNGLMVNGYRTDYVRRSRQEAERATQLLSERCGFAVPVVGVVVTVNERNVTVKSQPKDVFVVRSRHVVKWLLTLGSVLADDQLAQIFAVARRSTTWR